MSKEEIISKCLQIVRDEYGNYSEEKLRQINFFSIDDIEAILDNLTE